MNLIIKGTVEDAKRAAESRGIEITNVRALANGREVVANAADDCRTAVICWYCEESEMSEGEGYPPGTLLLHN